MADKEKSRSVLQNGSALSLDSVVASGDDAIGLLRDYDSMDSLELQLSEFSNEKTDSELQEKFVPKKKKSFILADCYKRLGFETKADKVRECGSFLEFAYAISKNGEISKEGKLNHANFCRDRLCPMCSWRRSYKIFGQVSQIMDKIVSDYSFIFVTLTVRSVTGPELPSTIDRLMRSWVKMFRYSRIQKVCKGYFRALEVTRNTDQGDKSFGLFHPHFHTIIAVPKSYFSSRDYIKQSSWLDYWRKAFKDPLINQVNVKKCRSKYSINKASCGANFSLSEAVAEISKYTVKDSDYLFENNSDLTDDSVFYLSQALKGRRLASFGGIFKKVFHDLKLQDAESDDADLVHLDENLNSEITYLICRYGWSMGAYKMTDIYLKDSSEAEIRI